MGFTGVKISASLKGVVTSPHLSRQFIATCSRRKNHPRSGSPTFWGIRSPKWPKQFRLRIYFINCPDVWYRYLHEWLIYIELPIYNGLNTYNNRKHCPDLYLVCWNKPSGTEDRDNYYFGADELFQQPGTKSWWVDASEIRSKKKAVDIVNIPLFFWGGFECVLDNDMFIHTYTHIFIYIYISTETLFLPST